jgi:uncharacterized repeat protein (TIGR03917 family)
MAAPEARRRATSDGGGCAHTGRACSRAPGEPEWDRLSNAELESLVAGLPTVEIRPLGEGTLAIMLREGAHLVDLRTVLGFLPEHAVLNDVSGDVEFVMAFEVPERAP